MATILAHIHVQQGKATDFEETISTLYEATHRLEPQCRRYEYWRGAEPNLYYCLLSFDDFVAFLEHQTSDHHEAPEFGAMIESLKLEWVDPVQSASELAPTKSQQLPDNANQLMTEYAKKFAVEMQAWWQIPD